MPMLQLQDETPGSKELVMSTVFGGLMIRELGMLRYGVIDQHWARAFGHRTRMNSFQLS